MISKIVILTSNSSGFLSYGQNSLFLSWPIFEIRDKTDV